MLFEIIREITYPFGDTDEEQWNEPEEFKDINEAVNSLKDSKGLFGAINNYKISIINEESNYAEFTIDNRGRYSGDTFIIRPYIA